MLNFPLALSVVAAVVGVTVALLGLGLGSAPSWGRYRALAPVGLTAAFFAVLDACYSSEAFTIRTRVVALMLQGAVAALHVLSWQSYVRRHLALPRRPVDRAVTGLLLLIAALYLVPGLMARDVMVSVEVPWLGVTYRFPQATLVGSFGYAFVVALFAVPLAHYVRAMRAGFPDARLHALALGAIFVAALNDMLVALEVTRSPLLLLLGFIGAVGALGFAVIRGFVASARELERLSHGLEELVAERTRELVAAEAALHRAEKMAAIGQLAAGVAHEINNPGAAVEANLTYLREALEAGAFPADAVECLDESIEGIARITKIVGQLLDSGRAAARARSGSATASVLRAVKQALAMSGPRLREGIATSVDVPPTLVVQADESSLVQVLVNLVVNAAQAIPSARALGTVQIRSTTAGERVVIEICDDGPGMSEETQRRLFEPFFTTKATGGGTGLGLAVSLGLVRSMGGDIEVASTPDGTCMRVVLDGGGGARAEAAASASLAMPNRPRD